MVWDIVCESYASNALRTSGKELEAKEPWEYKIDRKTRHTWIELWGARTAVMLIGSWLGDFGGKTETGDQIIKRRAYVRAQDQDPVQRFEGGQDGAIFGNEFVCCRIFA